jgi:hypothetical protein
MSANSRNGDFGTSTFLTQLFGQVSTVNAYMSVLATKNNGIHAFCVMAEA